MTPMDLEARPWVAHSGWPISWDELEPWFEPAGEVLGVNPLQEPETWEGSARPLLELEPRRLTTRIFTFSDPIRMGEEYGEELLDSDEVSVVVDASVTDLVSGQELGFRTLAGRSFTARVRFTVLACGGIENARLLLANGLGGDACGRFFMDHPHIRPTGDLVLAGGDLERFDLYAQRSFDPLCGCKASGLLALPEAVIRKEQLLDAVLMLRDLGEVELGATGRAARSVAESWDGPGLAGYGMVLAEMAPNPDSRITLLDETDALGLPRVRLDWKLQQRDAQSILRTLERMSLALGAEGVGRLQIGMGEARPWAELRGGHHHIGTTRMSESPDDGVVDADGQLWDLDGLYLAGSSVFPTSGACNPTLTIVALALRLADHLEQRLP